MDFKKIVEKLQNLPDNQKKIVLWTIVGVLGIIMGYFWIIGALNTISKIGSEVGQIKLPEIQTPEIPSAVTSTDQTAVPALSGVEGWKTYTNTEYGFAIKIPSDWVTDEGYGAGMMFTTEDLLKKEGENSLNCQQKKECDAEFSPTILYFVIIEKNADIYTKDDVLNGTSKIQLNGIDWVRYQPPAFYPETHYRTVSAGKGYDFVVYSDEDEITLKQILSTFKFIE